MAESSVTAWRPLFQGVDHATGTNDAGMAGPLSVNAIRIDLHDPDVELMVTPALTNNYSPGSRETALQTPREFLKQHGLQLAINAGFFTPAGYSSPSGTPADVHGLVISMGNIVSSQNNSNNSLSAMLFGTNKEAAFVFANWPATNTDGIFTAVSGMYPILSNGENIGYAYANVAGTIHDPQPRTAFGLSADGRHLILVTIDGRQDFSGGAVDGETADFLILFGGHNGMGMDGGGSTCLVMADACGDPIDLNHNSYQEATRNPGSQRPVGCNFGVRAKPARDATNPGFISDFAVEPGRFNASFLWTTAADATSQVEYGLTNNAGVFTPLDAFPKTQHRVTINGLIPGTRYYFRVISVADGVEYSQSGCMSTTNQTIVLFGLTNQWKYATNNLDGVHWTAASYDDSTWLGPGPGLLYVEDNINVAPKNTGLPPNHGAQVPMPPITYYFRTRFHFAENPAGVSLTFFNHIDDGAVFYLNGNEIYRLRMPAAPAEILNATLATGFSCDGFPTQFAGDACTNCPTSFTVTGSAATNLITGENVLAVEVHNYRPNSPDLVFGSALSYVATLPPADLPALVIQRSQAQIVISWSRTGFILQTSDDLTSWEDLSRTETEISYTPNPIDDARFFRLKQP